MAALAFLLPPRFNRIRVVFPLEVGIGQMLQSFASIASDRIRSGLSPTKISISATVNIEIPCDFINSGALLAIKRSNRHCGSGSPHEVLATQ
jgi:hypothetical protein